ncbi:MAG: hypothetical protein ACI4IK_01475 [Eubacterium sp.]
MKVDITQAKWNMDDSGAWLSVKVQTVADAKGIVDGMQDGKIYTVEVKRKTKKRSLNANAYMWELCQKLAEVNGITKEEVYRNAIKDVGIFRIFNLPPEEAKTLRTAWEMIGVGWLTEQLDYMPDGETVSIICYYGSSKYNTKQMSRLIDYIVQDCKACGIETLSDAELSLLESEWCNEQAK